MCGICGIVGVPNAARLVLQGLRSLEYRGYDSCGVAWLDGALHAKKAVGGVDNLRLDGPAHETAALGHTRWATHGNVTQENAHPHLDCGGDVAVVHNGVLLNYETLRDALTTQGHTFRSQTDSEVLAHLWESHAGADGLERLRRLVQQLKGTFSIAILDRTEAALYVAKERNPLWVGATKTASFLASDPVALKPHLPAATPLEDGDHARLTPGRIDLFDAAGRPVQRTAQPLAGLDDRIDKAGYEHFMLKEIHETPASLNRILSAHVTIEPPHVDLHLPDAFLAKAQRVLFLGAGTSFHAGLLGAQFVRRLARLPADAQTSPEYKDATSVPEKGTLVVLLSQSGETLDTLQALHRIESLGPPLLALTNFPKSSIGRKADHVLELRTGVEVGVAATKTFLSQSLLVYLLALALARQRGTVGDAALLQAATELKRFSRAIDRVLFRTAEAGQLARELSRFDHVFLLAKDLLLPAAFEGALKLKEIAYLHAEAYAAGELKHGPFALLEKSTAVVFLLAPGAHEASLRNSLHEVHARGAPTFVIAMDGAQDPGPLATHTLWVPAAPFDLQPLVFSTALHLVSYWVAKARALPIDRPRNLAKSVTVE
ncbi:MAG: glutamine--fructose-6-phosphate transaminase (isomerizing) [Euryarchaeota archaeon]|nr:glutamine--fructose-6-phosphate transaminase (isomerizing) [Euryarchaeota archaeon]